MLFKATMDVIFRAMMSTASSQDLIPYGLSGSAAFGAVFFQQQPQPGSLVGSRTCRIKDSLRSVTDKPDGV